MEPSNLETWYILSVLNSYCITKMQHSNMLIPILHFGVCIYVFRYIYAPLNWVIISSGNGLTIVWRQAISWANGDLSFQSKFTFDISTKLEFGKWNPYMVFPGWNDMPLYIFDFCLCRFKIILIYFILHHILLQNYSRCVSFPFIWEFQWSACIQSVLGDMLYAMNNARWYYTQIETADPTIRG